MLIPLAILGMIQTVRDQLVAPEGQASFRIVEWIPRWQWRTWAIIWLTAILLVALEGIYRKVVQLENEKSKLEDELRRCKERQGKVEKVIEGMGPKLDRLGDKIDRW